MQLGPLVDAVCAVCSNLLTITSSIGFQLGIQLYPHLNFIQYLLNLWNCQVLDEKGDSREEALTKLETQSFKKQKHLIIHQMSVQQTKLYNKCNNCRKISRPPKNILHYDQEIKYKIAILCKNAFLFLHRWCIISLALRSSLSCN